MADSLTFNTHRYELVQSARTWLEAKQAAEASGGYLAVINSSEENAAVFAYLQQSGAAFTTADDGGGAAYVWLGASDRATEGAFVWVDGSPVSGYTNWGSGSLGQEPDDFNGAQDALALGLTAWPAPAGGIGVAGQWNDVSESNLLYYLVEWNAASPWDGSANIVTRTNPDGSVQQTVKNLKSISSEKLAGKAGQVDVLSAGAGDDTYGIDDEDDRVVEPGNGGVDEVLASISVNLGGQNLKNVENVTLQGSADLDATGNAKANILIGNGGSNILDGGLGSDTLTGGAGADTFLFEKMAGRKHVDFVTDFTLGQDKLAFGGKAYGKLDADKDGNMDANAFGTFLKYDAVSGVLSYDSNGGRAGGEAGVALIGAGLALTAADIVLA